MRGGGEAAMSFVGEFRAFALKGRVIDLAVSVIIGGRSARLWIPRSVT